MKPEISLLFDGIQHGIYRSSKSKNYENKEETSDNRECPQTEDGNSGSARVVKEI